MGVRDRLNNLTRIGKSPRLSGAVFPPTSSAVTIGHATSVQRTYHIGPGTLGGLRGSYSGGQPCRPTDPPKLLIGALNIQSLKPYLQKLTCELDRHNYDAMLLSET